MFEFRPELVDDDDDEADDTQYVSDDEEESNMTEVNMKRLDCRSPRTHFIYLRIDLCSMVHGARCPSTITAL